MYWASLARCWRRRQPTSASPNVALAALLAAAQTFSSSLGGSCHGIFSVSCRRRRRRSFESDEQSEFCASTCCAVRLAATVRWNQCGGCADWRFVVGAELCVASATCAQKFSITSAKSSPPPLRERVTAAASSSTQQTRENNIREKCNSQDGNSQV